MLYKTFLEEIWIKKLKKFVPLSEPALKCENNEASFMQSIL